MMSKTKAWIGAFRLRTLPLSLSSIFLGSFLARFADGFQWSILILASVTTLFLQILSNLANDYGDSVSGADNTERVGPTRAVQSGIISKNEMRTAIIVFSVLAFISGIWLVWLGTSGLGIEHILGFIGLGILAIIAAITYTVGNKPYGYSGLGDLSVFLFFGLTGVCGTYFLHTHQFDPTIILPSAAIGFLSMGVLNLNNMRDRENDQRTGKNTLVVKIGPANAKIYHTCLLGGALISSIIYLILHYQSPYQWIYLVTVPLLAGHLKAVLKNKKPQELDPQLKKLALTTLIFSITFGSGMIL